MKSMNKKLHKSNKLSSANCQLQTVNSSGQILVVLLLIMVVGLTVGLFLLSRTTTDVSLTTKISDSTRAFNAAEAGIEEAIRNAGSVPQGSPVAVGVEGATFQVTTTTLGSGNIYPETIPPATDVGKNFTVWLVNYNEATGQFDESASAYTGNEIDICYTGAAGSVPAVSVTAYWKNGGQYFSSYVGYDSVAGRRSTSNFLPTVALGGCTGYFRRARVDLNTDFGPNLKTGGNVVLALRIRPVYFSSSIAVLGVGSNIPRQGNLIDSTGAVGEIVRRINVDEPYTVPAPFLDHAVYSTGANSNLEK